jgi:flotillin
MAVPRTSVVVIGMVAVLLAFGVVGFGTLFVARSSPTEWLLVISDGELKQAGVGITAILGPMDQAVRLPAAIHKVSLSAQQVSQEMQGVEVSGFIVWTVNRVGDGPFKCYRYLEGLSGDGLREASSHIQGMAESIIRHQVANLRLQEVITNRTLLRDKVREEMHSIVQGWGIWLETVEVTDVRVLSSSVFDDLQTEYRQELRGKSEQARIAGTRAINLERDRADDEVQRARDELEQERERLELWGKLELERERAKVAEESHLLELEKLKRRREVELQEVAIEGEVARRRAEEAAAAQVVTSKAELTELRERLEVEKGMSGASLQRVVVEAAKEVFKSLPLHDVRLYHTGNAGQGLEGLIPGLAHLQDALGKEER